MSDGACADLYPRRTRCDQSADLVYRRVASDTIATIKARAARKLAIPDEGADIVLKYLWCDVFYTLDDGTPLPSCRARIPADGAACLLSSEDDFDVFLTRHQNSPEVTLLLSSPHIPTQNPSIASVSSLPPSSTFSSLSGAGGPRADPDASSLYSSRSFLYGRGETRDVRQGTSLHLVVPSGRSGDGAGSTHSTRSGRSVRSAHSNGADTTGGRSRKGSGKSLHAAVPEHKIKFEEFHNQVRLVAGSARSHLVAAWLNELTTSSLDAVS